ncbi:MAG: hypothetical protein WC755_00550 [Candidatus Woesearchaeota archaeon]
MKITKLLILSFLLFGCNNEYKQRISDLESNAKKDSTNIAYLSAENSTLTKHISKLENDVAQERKINKTIDSLIGPAAFEINNKIYFIDKEGNKKVYTGINCFQNENNWIKYLGKTKASIFLKTTIDAIKIEGHTADGYAFTREIESIFFESENWMPYIDKTNRFEIINVCVNLAPREVLISKEKWSSYLTKSEEKIILLKVNKNMNQELEEETTRVSRWNEQQQQEFKSNAYQNSLNSMSRVDYRNQTSSR